jgi:hemerythrin-like domain-containing protein
MRNVTMNYNFTSPLARQSARPNGTGVKVAVGVAGFGLGLLAAAARKAAVQAPTFAAGDWFEGLVAEHKIARTLFEKLAQTTDAELPQRAALLLELQHAIGRHNVEEENVIYCVLRDNGEAAEADALHADHGQLKQGLFDLEMIGKQQKPGFLTRLAEVRAAFEAHVREEEEDVFPALREKLGDDVNTATTARMNREGFKVA